MYFHQAAYRSRGVLGPVNTMQIPIDGGHFLTGKGALSVLYLPYKGESAAQPSGKIVPSLRDRGQIESMRCCPAIIWNHQTSLCTPCTKDTSNGRPGSFDCQRRATASCQQVQVTQ